MIRAWKARLVPIALGLLLGGAVPVVAQQPAPAADEHPAYVQADYSYANFQGDIAGWHTLALSASRGGPSGTLIGRLNLARRFDTNGAQIEADAYPRLGEHTYAYVNAGYSGSDIFPEWRFGGEVFRNLPSAWEASLGMRHLRFGGPPVNLFTGSVGKYRGNYWFSLRSFARHKDTGTSASASVTARRYYQDGDNYIGGRIGYGTGPGDDDITAVELARLTSSSVSAQWSRTIAERVIGRLSLTYEREEIVADRFRNRIELSAGVRLKLR